MYKNYLGTSLVARWLRIRLPVQGTRVRSLVQEDPTCCGETKPVHHNYWAHTPQLLKSTCSRARMLQLLSLCAATTEACAPRAHAPQQREASAMRSPCAATKSSPCSPQLEKARVQQWRPNGAKNKLKKKKKKKRIQLAMQGTPVWSLVRELRSHMLRGN